MPTKTAKVIKSSMSPTGSRDSTYTCLWLEDFPHQVFAGLGPRIDVGEKITIHSAEETWNVSNDNSVGPDRIDILNDQDEVKFSWFSAHQSHYLYADVKPLNPVLSENPASPLRFVTSSLAQSRSRSGFLFTKLFVIPTKQATHTPTKNPSSRKLP